MVQEGSMAGAARRGAVAGWPSPSNYDDAAPSTLAIKVSSLLRWLNYTTWLSCVCISHDRLHSPVLTGLRSTGAGLLGMHYVLNPKPIIPYPTLHPVYLVLM